MDIYIYIYIYIFFLFIVYSYRYTYLHIHTYEFTCICLFVCLRMLCECPNWTCLHCVREFASAACYEPVIRCVCVWGLVLCQYSCLVACLTARVLDCRAVKQKSPVQSKEENWKYFDLELIVLITRIYTGIPVRTYQDCVCRRFLL